MKTWTRRAGLMALAFFAVKGLAWLGLAVLAAASTATL